MGPNLWEPVVGFLTGASGQLVDGVAGMGFGALATTLLTLAGIAPVLAVATVSIAKVGSGISSGISHWQFGNVRWSWVVPLATSGVAGGVSGAFAFSLVPVDSARAFVPWLLLGIGLIVLLRYAKGQGLAPPEVRGASDVAVIGGAPAAPPTVARGRTKSLVIRYGLHGIGFAAGLVNAGTGAYGPVATSLLMSTRPSHPRYVVGTVSVVEPIVAASVAAVLVGTLGAGGVAWRLLGGLMLGAAITAPLAAMVARRASARAMGIFVGAVMVLINGGLLLASGL